MNIKNKIASTLFALSVLIGLGTVASATTLRVVQTPTLHLYTGQSISATTMRVTPYPKDLDGTKLTISDFGTLPTVTVDPKLSGIEEIESFTTITDNGDNTATLSGITRNLVSKYPYTTGGTGRTHGAGSTVVFGNNPQIYGRLWALENQATSTDILYFTSTFMPRFDTDPGAAAYTAAPTTVFVDMAQLSRTAIAGASNATRALQGLLQVAFRGQAASSTSLGTTGAFAALTTDIATSSPSISMSTSSVVMTRLDSRIDPLFMSTSSTYTFGGIVANTGGIFTTASSTILATTTLSANVALGKGLCLNTVCYTLPSTQGTQYSIPVNNGSGVVSWGGVPKLSNVGVTGISLSTIGVATSTTQITIPAGLLNSSSTIEIYGGGTGSASAANAAMNCTLAVRDGTGKTLNSFTITSAAASGASAPFTYHAFISATSTTASQYTYISGIGVDSGLGAGTGVTTVIDTLANTGINFSNALTLTVYVVDATTNGGCSSGNVQYIVNI